MNEKSYLQAEVYILFKAVSENDTKTIQAAIERKAPLDLKDKYGDSLLHKASEAKASTVASLLLKSRPNILNTLNDYSLNAYDVFSLTYSEWKNSLTALQKRNLKKQADFKAYSSMAKLYSKIEATHTEAFEKTLKERKKKVYR